MALILLLGALGLGFSLGLFRLVGTERCCWGALCNVLMGVLRFELGSLDQVVCLVLDFMFMRPGCLLVLNVLGL